VPQIKAILTDYIGTLVNPRNYSLEASMDKLRDALFEVGFRTDEKYRAIRYGELREVTNAVWVSEALADLGFQVPVDDSRMNEALNVFFQDFIDSLELRPCAEKFLEKAQETCRLGLVSNFTYAPAVYSSLRKLDISDFFSVIMISHENGYRKPHQKIFQDTLQRLQVKAKEALYIGDSPQEDIKGALKAGLKTIFISSQFYSLSDLQNSKQKPHLTVQSLEEICQTLPKITT
jgi:putative hydrolase of the HAD superfamily